MRSVVRLEPASYQRLRLGRVARRSHREAHREHGIRHCMTGVDVEFSALVQEPTATEISVASSANTPPVKALTSRKTASSNSGAD